MILGRDEYVRLRASALEGRDFANFADQEAFWDEGVDRGV
jgi:hypothetical protein